MNTLTYPRLYYILRRSIKRRIKKAIHLICRIVFVALILSLPVLSACIKIEARSQEKEEPLKIYKNTLEIELNSNIKATSKEGITLIAPKIESLRPIEKEKTIEEIIREAAIRHNVDPNFLVALANKESGLNPNTTHLNSDGSVDRGIMQWNTVHIQRIPDSCAYDVSCASEFAASDIQAGKECQWMAVAKVYDLNLASGYRTPDTCPWQVK
jgi:hypothetical protein